MTASPTTSGASPSSFRPFSEVAYSRPLARPPTAAARAHSTWGIPRTGEECERVLLAAITSTMTLELVAYLAGFLGASSQVWTASRRHRLRNLLARYGTAVVPIVLAAVARAPREEVVDETVDVLILAAAADARVVEQLSTRLLEPHMSGSEDALAEQPSARATIARALGRLHARGATRAQRLSALAVALEDVAPEVRDAAIEALASSSLADRSIAMRLLEQHSHHEPEEFLLEAISDSLVELRGK